MELKTRLFGDIEIEETGIITFEDGIPGFDDIKKYVLLGDPEVSIEWLQGIEEDVTIPIIDPFEIKLDYEFEIPENIEQLLDIKNPDDVIVRTVLVIPENIKEIRTNLQGPIVINKSAKKGKQLILNEEYPIKYFLHDTKEGVK